MSIKKLSMICFLLLWVAIPVYAHEEDVHISDIEMIVAGIGVLILTGGVFSLLFQKKTDDDEELA